MIATRSLRGRIVRLVPLSPAHAEVDARWNAEYQIQLRTYGAQRMHSCELNATRYDQVAATLGCHGEHVARPDELAPALDRAAASGKAACINVAIDSQPAPVVRRKTTANAAAAH